MNEGGDPMGNLVKERMTRTFDIIPETLTPAEASSKLTAGNYGVILDSYGTPIALVVAKDLEQAVNRGVPSLRHPSASLPPIIIIGSEIEMQMLAESKALTMFDVGARGAVVVGDKEVVGVLPVEVVDKYMGSGEYKPLNKTKGLFASKGDTGLGGRFQTPRGKVRCLECGFVNTVDFIDENNLPTCQNQEEPPHTLRF